MLPLKTVAVPVKPRRSAHRAQAPEIVAKAADEEPTGLSPLRSTQPRAAVARPTHRFAVGERLQVTGGGRTMSRAAGPATVLARLPHEGGPLLYRMKLDAEGYERIVAEADLAALVE